MSSQGCERSFNGSEIEQLIFCCPLLSVCLVQNSHGEKSPVLWVTKNEVNLILVFFLSLFQPIIVIKWRTGYWLLISPCNVLHLFIRIPMLEFLMTPSASSHALVRWTIGCLLPYLSHLSKVFLATQKEFLVIQTHLAIEKWVTWFQQSMQSPLFQQWSTPLITKNSKQTKMESPWLQAA